MLIGLLVPILVNQTILRSLQYCLVFSYFIEMSDWAKSGWKYYETRGAEDPLSTLLLANIVYCVWQASPSSPMCSKFRMVTFLLLLTTSMELRG